MAVFVYLFSIAFVLPAFLLGYAVNAVDRTRQQVGILATLLYALERFCRALSWHLLVLVAVLFALIGIGFSERFCWVGELAVGLAGLGSLIYVWVRCRLPDQLGQIILFLPSWIGTVAAVWLTVVNPRAPWARLLVSGQP